MSSTWSPARSRFRRAFTREALPSTFAAGGLLFAAFALLTPWYAVDIAIGVRHVPYTAYGLAQETEFNPDGSLLVKPYESEKCGCPALEQMFNEVQLIAWTGALMAAFAFWARAGEGRPKGALRLAVTAIAGVLLVAGPILLALDLPQAFQADGKAPGTSSIRPTGLWGANFTGSYAASGITHAYWGPAIGWFLMLLGGALTLASIRRERGPTAAEAPAASPSKRASGAPLAVPPSAP